MNCDLNEFNDLALLAQSKCTVVNAHRYDKRLRMDIRKHGFRPGDQVIVRADVPWGQLDVIDQKLPKRGVCISIGDIIGGDLIPIEVMLDWPIAGIEFKDAKTQQWAKDHRTWMFDLRFVEVDLNIVGRV